MKCPKCQNAELVQSSKVLGDSMAKYMEAVGLPAEVEKKL